MNPVEEFYRGKKILKIIKDWRQPLKFTVKESHVEIAFIPGIWKEFSNKERAELLKVIVAELSWSNNGGGGLTCHLIERLEKALIETKEGIKTDLDIPIYRD